MAGKKKSSSAISGFDEAKWQAESDMHALARAQEIRKDPKRLAAAKKMAEEKLNEMQAVAGVVEAK